MRPVTTIPWEKYQSFTDRLVKELSGNYSVNRMDLVESLNRKLAGWPMRPRVRRGGHLRIPNSLSDFRVAIIAS